MSLKDTVSKDARAIPANMAAKYDAVKSVTYDKDALRDTLHNGMLRRDGESVVVNLEYDATAAELTEIVRDVEDNTDWVLNVVDEIAGEAHLVFTGEWW